MKCSKCHRDAVIFQRYSGLHLCGDHFVQDVEAKARRAIRKHHWIQSGDRVAVALSGGKDSSAVLYFLQTLLRKRRDTELFAVTIDEGIRGYRDPACAAGVAASIGVECVCASFAEIYGITLDEIVRERGDALSCSYCGVMRRTALNLVAREHGANKLAFGFNLDDEAQSVLMNVLRGDVRRLVRPMQPVPGLVPRIKPFINVPEREVALYAFMRVEGFDLCGCPYAHNALRADVRSLLNSYAYRHPATKNALVNLGENLSHPEITETASQAGMTTCEHCGEPCGGVCRTCQIMDEVRRYA